MVGFLDNPKVLREEIRVPYSIIEKDTGLSRQSVRNALIQLENFGFIDLCTQGGLKSGGYTMNGYCYSIRFGAYGTPLFKPGTLKKEENICDRGFAKMWKKRKTEGKDKNHTRVDIKTIPVGNL